MDLVSLDHARMIMGPGRTVGDYLTWLEEQASMFGQLDPSAPVEYAAVPAGHRRERYMVYRVIEDGETVYIGVTKDIEKRWTLHLRSSRWSAPTMAIVAVAIFDTASDALARERQLIEQEQPVHNVRYTGRDPRRGAL